MSSTIINPPNGILFLFDPTDEDAEIPTYIDDELFASTETCISIGTQAPDDGDTKVSLLVSNDPVPGLQKAFVGAISSISGKIAVITAEFEIILEADVPKGEVDVSIWVDDLRSPTQIVISINT